MNYSLSTLEIIEEEKYIVSLNISTCLETNSVCMTDIEVLHDSVLPKQACDLDFDFVDKGECIRWLKVVLELSVTLTLRSI